MRSSTTTPICTDRRLRLTHDRVLVRSWHTAASNPSDQPRVAVVARFAPWWLTAEMGWGDGAQEWVPRPIYDQMGPALQKLVRHRTCGVEDELQTPVRDHLRTKSLAGFALLTPRLCC